MKEPNRYLPKRKNPTPTPLLERSMFSSNQPLPFFSNTSESLYGSRSDFILKVKYDKYDQTGNIVIPRAFRLNIFMGSSYLYSSTSFACAYRHRRLKWIKYLIVGATPSKLYTLSPPLCVQVCLKISMIANAYLSIMW